MNPAEHPPTPNRFPSELVEALHCPLCQRTMRRDKQSLVCVDGHCFDIAKQGYVNLLTNSARGPAGDTAAMLVARLEFLAAGHYAPLAALIADRIAKLAPHDGLVLDAGAGTGYYLHTVLDRTTSVVGLAMDSSIAALRRCVSGQPRIGAIAWNIWQPWPLRSHSVHVILNVFAPRNSAEFSRVLRPDGTLLVVTPTVEHLGELRAFANLLAVDADKRHQLDAALSRHFLLNQRETCSIELALSPSDVRKAIEMGPNAYHLHRDGQQVTDLSAIPDLLTVTASFTLSAYRPLS